MCPFWIARISFDESLSQKILLTHHQISTARDLSTRTSSSSSHTSDYILVALFQEPRSPPSKQQVLLHTDISSSIILSSSHQCVSVSANQSIIIIMHPQTLYRRLIREAKQMHDYNFRMYALRRIRAGFEKNRLLDG